MAEYIVSIEKKEDAEELERLYCTQEFIRCKDCIKKDLCCLYRDTKDENGFCKWAAQMKRKK